MAEARDAPEAPASRRIRPNPAIFVSSGRRARKSGRSPEFEKLIIVILKCL